MLGMGNRFSYTALIRCVILIVYLFVSASTMRAEMSVTRVNPNVLILHSYHRGFKGTDNMQRGIMEVIDSAQITVNTFTEYMDTKRYNPLQIENEILSLYQKKYASVPFDVIIACDNNAVNFALKYRKALFAQTPISFCGFNNYSDTLISKHSSITGVAEDFDLRSNIALAHRLFPNRDSLVVVSGNAFTSKLNLTRAKNLEPEFDSLLTFVYADTFSVAELKEYISGLSNRHSILNLSFWRDKNGAILNHQEGLDFFKDFSPVPVFTAWEHMIDSGTIGGMTTSGYLQGKTAARKAIQILSGIPADSLPVLTQSPNQYIFNYPELIRFGLSVQDLPEGSKIISKEITFFDKHKEHIKAVGISTVVVIFSVIVFFVLVLLNNINKLHTAQNALSESENRYRLLVESIDEGVVLTDTEFTIIFANRSITRMFGFTKDELLGKPGLDFASRIENENLEEINRSLKESTHVVNEITFRTKSGTLIDTVVKISSIVDEYKASVGFLVIITDVGEKERFEQHQRHSEKMEAIGQLAGGIAHDFNNQLVGIMGFAELLRDDLNDRPELLEYIENILSASRHSADLTTKLLAFARKGKYLQKVFDMHSIISDVAALIMHTVDKRISVNLKLDASESELKGDPNQIQNAILNLAINARDAMPEGGLLTFETRNCQLDQTDCKLGGLNLKPGSYLEILVSDTGVGIDSINLKRVFEPFFTTKSDAKGTGMGLAAVYGTVVNHHGAVSVDSKVNQGSTFSILLPVQTESKLSVPDTVTRPVAAQGRYHVMLVDDEVHICKLGKIMLEKLGYKATVCESGIKAISKFRTLKNEISLVILDLVMPGKNGKAVFHEMRTMNPQVKILLSSGYSLDTEAQELLDSGAVGFLQKPYENITFSHAIAKVIASPMAEPASSASHSR